MTFFLLGAGFAALRNVRENNMCLKRFFVFLNKYI